MDHCRTLLPSENTSRPPAVSDRALEFLDRWEADHVEAVPPQLRGVEAARLPDLCREDAMRAGIAIFDLERAAKGSLVRNMLDALEAAPDRRLEE
jgi:hypothetical protein